MKAIRKHRKLHWALILLLLFPSGLYAEDGKSALVIIDMQPIFVTRGGSDQLPENARKVNQILQAQVQAIQAAEVEHIPIVFLEYEDDGATNDTLKEAVKGYGDTAFFLKNTDGMFDNFNRHRAELDQYLKSKGIKTLIVTGANGGACVRESIQGALIYNYHVVAYKNGIADFNYRDFMYPYKYDNGDIKPRCLDCTFRQVDDLSEVLPAISQIEVAPIAANTPKQEDPGCVTEVKMPEEDVFSDFLDLFSGLL